MNTKTLKGITAAVTLLVGIGAASPALATLTPAQALGNSVNAIDVWTFECPPNFPIAQARVFDVAPINNPALLQVVLGKDGAPTVQVTDPNEGGQPSGFATVPDGIGGYVMAFKKTAGGGEGYIGEARCVNGANIANPVLQRRINQ